MGKLKKDDENCVIRAEHLKKSRPRTDLPARKPMLIVECETVIVDRKLSMSFGGSSRER